MPKLRFAESFVGDVASALSLSASFGTQEKYRAFIAAALRRIAGDPSCLNSRDRSEDIGASYRSLHLRHVTSSVHPDLRLTTRPVHSILYRVERDTDVVRILRLFHDRQELRRLIDED